MAGSRPGSVPLGVLLSGHLAKLVVTLDLVRSVVWISFFVDQMENGVMTQAK